MLAHASSPKALDVHGFSFDSVDRCFAAMATAAFVGLVAIVMWVWLSAPSPKPLHLDSTAISAQSANVDAIPLRLARLPAAGPTLSLVARHDLPSFSF
jgi:hypothetical protein